MNCFEGHKSTLLARLPPSVVPKFFVGIDERTVGLILDAAQLKQTPAKKTIITMGDRANQFFLITCGQIRYYRPTKSGHEVLLCLLAPGDVFGLGTLLKHPPPYVGSAETESECELFVWTHTSIRKLAQAHPGLAENSLRVVLYYLERYIERHAGIVTKTAEHRLADVLLDLAQRTGHVSATGVELAVTNERLSSLAHISPFTTSHILAAWRKRGFVSKQRYKVFVHAPEALALD